MCTGHGRAGVIATCIAGLAFQLTAHEALTLCQHAHDARCDPAWPLATPQPSPQTQPQREQCVALLNAVARLSGSG